MQLVWNDEPCETDALGRGDVVNALTAITRVCDTPLVVGLYGAWGVGKTSVMRLIQEQLEHYGEYTVWFDAWQHQFDENPAIALLHKMVAELQLGEEGRRLLLAISGAFSELLLKRVTGVSMKDIRELQEQYEKERFAVRETQIRLRDYFKNLLGRATDNGEARVVFFIDDLDRCLPETVLQVLEALKLFLNMPGCVYVLGVDRTALESSIKKRYPGSEVNEVEYLDKIVQLPFSIPRVDRSAASAYIHGLLPTHLREPLEFLVDGIGQNPRQIKRFVNAFVLNYELTRHSAGSNAHPTALAAILLLQMRYPDVYKELLLDEKLLKEPRSEWLTDPVVSTALRYTRTASSQLLRQYLSSSAVAAAREVPFDVVLTDPGERKIQVIKVVREHTGLGLKEAKDLVDAAADHGETHVASLPRDKAEEMLERLQEAGAKATLR